MIIKLNLYRYWVALSALFTLGILFFLDRLGLFNAIMTFMLMLAIATMLHLLIELFLKGKTPEYFSYNEDTFYDITWRWDWNLNKQILHLVPYCPTCQKMLYSTFDTLLNQTEFVCNACDKQVANVNSSNRNFVAQSVKKSIVRKLKKQKSGF